MESVNQIHKEILKYIKGQDQQGNETLTYKEWSYYNKETQTIFEKYAVDNIISLDGLIKKSFGPIDLVNDFHLKYVKEWINKTEQILKTYENLVSIPSFHMFSKTREKRVLLNF